jgi:hypothetical protein
LDKYCEKLHFLNHLWYKYDLDASPGSKKQTRLKIQSLENELDLVY